MNQRLSDLRYKRDEHQRRWLTSKDSGDTRYHFEMVKLLEKEIRELVAEIAIRQKAKEAMDKAVANNHRKIAAMYPDC